MAKITWAFEAEQWLKDIHDYIAKDNPKAAVRVVDGIYDRVQMLKDNPHIGHLYDRLPRKKSAFSFSAIIESPIWSKSTEVLIFLGFFMRLWISKNTYLLNGDFKSFLQK